MSQTTLEQIRSHLDTAKIAYREVEHEPTRTYGIATCDSWCLYDAMIGIQRTTAAPEYLYV